MSAHSASSAPVEEHFSLPLFLFTLAVTLAGLAVLFKLVAPDMVWAAQRSAGIWAFAAAFLSIHMLTCFSEHLFHRYVLHKPVIPFLSRFYKQHTLHHNLTRIGRRRTPGGREVPFVENVYPVTEPEQGEASFFPWYTLAVFAAAVTPLLALLQWLIPACPWFFAGYLAVAGAMALYEIFHAIEHWSFARWAPLIEHRRFGWFWRKVYSFHLRHHAVIDCNEAISGFFTLPVADWVFGTYKLPKTLFVNGAEWNASEFESPRPRALIRWCDAKCDALIKQRRARAAAAAPSAVQNYSRGEVIAHHFTQSTGLLAGIAAFVVLIVFAVMRGNALHVASCMIFGATVLSLYLAFMNFKPVRVGGWRLAFHKFNHAAAFLLIAGTSTPFLLVNLRGPWGWSVFSVVWICCIGGALAQLLFEGRWRVVSHVAYVLLGVVGLISLKPFVAAVPLGALWLVLGGIACYVCGTIFHVWEEVRYHQAMRHAFALGGTACHLFAVLFFVLPVQA